MTKEEFMAKLQMVYVGDKNAFNELIYAYDDMQKRNNKAIEYINKQIKDNYYCRKSSDLINSLLSILQGEKVVE